MRQVLGAGALGRPRGMGWGRRREGGSGWGTHVNPWLIHVNVWQKPLQYGKVINLQLIKINGGKKTVKSLSSVRPFASPWTVAHHAPPSMGFSRQEYWSGLPFLSPGDLPDPEIEPRSPALQANALTSEPSGKPICYD